MAHFRDSERRPNLIQQPRSCGYKRRTGFGQIVQGRYGKGILFFVCLYTLFFYGNYVGSGSVTLHGRKHTINGTVYVAYSGNNRIQKFTSTGAFIDACGSAGTSRLTA